MDTLKIIKKLEEYSTFNIDTFATIIDKDKTTQEVGEEIFGLMVKVANGELTKSERNKQNQFAIRQEGFNYPTFKEVAEMGL